MASSDNLLSKAKQASLADDMNKCRFIEKLFLIVEDPVNNEAICWSEIGDSIILKDIKLLADNVLPKYFAGIKYNSFLRQINLYGFKRLTRAAAHEREYQQPFFRRDSQNLLAKIKRRVIRDKSKHSDKKPNGREELRIPNQISTNFRRDVEGDLLFEINRAKREIQLLQNENSFLRSLCLDTRTMQSSHPQQGPIQRKSGPAQLLTQQKQNIFADDLKDLESFLDNIEETFDPKPCNVWPSIPQQTRTKPFNTQAFNDDFNLDLHQEDYKNITPRTFQYQGSLVRRDRDLPQEPRRTNTVDQFFAPTNTNTETVSQQDLLNLFDF